MKNIAVVVALVLVASLPAFANSDGQTGNSISGCSSCHSGSNTGTRPTVTLSGPSSVTPGSTSTYTLTISGPSGVGAGLDVSVVGGTLQTASSNEQLIGGELTQTAPATMSGQSYAYSFKVVAGTGASMGLYATGISTNGDGTASGDKDAQTSMTVAIGGTGGTPPTITQQAAAAPSTVSATTTQVSALASGTGLVYSWTASGPGAVTFSPNDSSGAATSTATFSAAGSYSVTVSVSNGSASATSSASVTVAQTLTAIRVMPSNPTVPPSGVQLFTAGGADQFGGAMNAPAATWMATGDGSITSAGDFTAGGQAGTSTVTATAAGMSATSTVTVGASAGGPQIGFTMPSNATTVSGMVQLAATAMDAAGVASVTFGIDGDDFAVSTSAPYSVLLNSALFDNGSHTLTARAVDASGLAATSSVTVTVNNMSKMKTVGGCSAVDGGGLWALLGVAGVVLRSRKRIHNNSQKEGNMRESTYVVGSLVLAAALVGCRGNVMSMGGGGSGGSGSLGSSTSQNLDINTVMTPLCSITVEGGYPTGRQCNAAAMAIPEFVGCEVDDLQNLGELHAIRPGLPASRITWWCQSENATPLVMNCTQSASNPCNEVQIYPGIMIYNTATAIQDALADGLVPPVPIAPDGLPCPNGAGGDIGGIADMDPHDGPFINWLANPLTDGPMFNAFMDGDFNNVATRVPLYQGQCFRPSTHTLFLAQAVVARQQFNAPESGCPTIDDPFALDANGNQNLDILNQFRTAVGCPNPVPDMQTAATLEAAECKTFVADERRISLDGAMGLFPMGTVFVQLERQYAAFQNLGCNATYGLTDMNPQSCDPACANKQCGQDNCVGPCGLCPASDLSCGTNGKCAPVCVPQCAGKSCGPDGCGGYCGACTPGEACNTGTCQPVTSTAVSFANDVQPLLTSACTSCHTGNKLDFAFTADVSYASLVNVRSKSCPGRFFVVPGDSQDSYLMDKVQGILGLCAGSSMRAGLNTPQLQTIAAWIDQGALNN